MKFILAYNGKIKSDFKSLFEEYKKRINIDLIELKNRDKLNEFLTDKKYILLSEKGKEFTSLEFANFIKKNSEEGTLIFVIGDDTGFDKTVSDNASFILSLSKMTFPHDLTKIILLEQLYRAKSILDGTSYHK